MLRSGSAVGPGGSAGPAGPSLPTGAVAPVAHRHVGVVVPAHDEADRLGRCLRSIAAAAEVARQVCGVSVDVVVVLDDCSDGTASVAGAAGVRTVATAVGNVGAARALGTAAVLDRVAPGTPTWLVTTDADTTVPRGWLVGHLRRAARGADLVVGTVEVGGWSGWPSGLAAAFTADYGTASDGDGHPHVHGANLGISATAHRRIGGFAHLAVAEDHQLVLDAIAAGLRVDRTRSVPVRTSARPDGRAAGGFSARLAELADPVRSPGPVDGDGDVDVDVDVEIDVDRDVDVYVDLDGDGDGAACSR